MKYLKKMLFVVAIFLSTGVYAQVEIKNDTRKFLLPETDSLEIFMKLNKIDYALITYSTSNWISLDHIFYGIIRKKREYYLVRLANLDVHAKKPELKVNQKKLTIVEVQTYLKEIASNEAFKFSNEDYLKVSQSCKVIHGTNTVEEQTYDDSTLYIFEYTKNSKKSINTYAPSFFLEKCYPYNPEYGILKGFVNTYDKLTDLVEKAFKDDPILPIQNRPRTE
jgi:hypothetical protein